MNFTGSSQPIRIGRTDKRVLLFGWVILKFMVGTMYNTSILHEISHIYPATRSTIALVVMQMFTHMQISKIVVDRHIPLTFSAQKKYSS
jgi:hypothetical protein